MLYLVSSAHSPGAFGSTALPQDGTMMTTEIYNEKKTIFNRLLSRHRGRSSRRYRWPYCATALPFGRRYFCTRAHHFDMRKVLLFSLILLLRCEKETSCNLTDADCRKIDIHFSLTMDCECALIEPPQI